LIAAADDAPTELTDDSGIAECADGPASPVDRPHEPSISPIPGGGSPPR
jgi:hypothetical protein